MKDDAIKEMIKANEGRKDYVYLDSTGVPTVGYGCALHVGRHVPGEAVEAIFEHDFKQAQRDYDQLGLRLDPVRRAVVIDMLFNMGLDKVKGFKKMLSALRAGNWAAAAVELKDSRYYRQVKERGDRNADMLLSGKAAGK